MTLTPVDIQDIRLRESRHTYCKAQKVIEEFMRSGHWAVEIHIEPGEYKNLASAQSTLSKARRKLKAGCFPVMHQGKLYLVRSDIAQKMGTSAT